MNSEGAIRDARLGNVEPAVAYRRSGDDIVGSGRNNAFGGLSLTGLSTNLRQLDLAALQEAAHIELRRTT
jgi:hypothetical protein